MEEIVFKADKRTVIGKQVKALRRSGLLPGVIYGRRIDPVAISLNAHETSRKLLGLSRSHLVTVEVDGESHTVLLREKQRHPVTGRLLHVDFNAVSMTEKLRTTVGISLQGDAPAVKNFNGIIVEGIEEVEVESFPGDLPENIVVDLSVLQEIGDALYVRDLVPPERVEILNDPDDMIVLITAPVAEEEIEEEEALEEEAEPEVIEKGKREEEEAEVG